IAVYGLTAGTETSSANTMKATGVVSAGNFTNATTASLSNVDGNLATWVNNSNGNQSTTVTLGGYGPPAAIPAGSVLTSAQLRVAHGNTAGSKMDTLSVLITPTG